MMFCGSLLGALVQIMLNSFSSMGKDRLFSGCGSEARDQNAWSTALNFHSCFEVSMCSRCSERQADWRNGWKQTYVSHAAPEFNHIGICWVCRLAISCYR